MTRLILVRHGQTPWTRQRRYQGSTDIRLTAEGRREARATARRLKKIPVDFLYASSLNRANETGRIIAGVLKRKMRTDSRLNELSFGEWEGKTAEELIRAKDPRFKRWAIGKRTTPPGGESLSSLRKRVRSFLKEIVKRSDGKTVAIVSHGGPIKVMIFEAMKLPFRSFWTLRAEPGSMSLLEFHPYFAQCVLLNDTCHLKKRKKGE